MPELFGSAYILPAIVVVVLLLVLLLVLVMRKRSGAGEGGSKKTKQAVMPKTVPSRSAKPTAGATEPAAVAAAAGVAASSTATGLSSEAGALSETDATDTATPEVGVMGGVAAVSQAVTPSVAPRPLSPANDPLKAVVLDIMTGWGDLTQQDTNRLNLFRPDRILATLESIKPPREDTGGGSARARFLQMRNYAVDRQARQEAEAAAAPAAAVVEEPAVEMPAAEAWPASDRPGQTTVDSPAAAQIQPAEVQAQEIEPEETQAQEVASVETYPEEVQSEEAITPEPGFDWSSIPWDPPEEAKPAAGAGLAAAVFAGSAADDKIQDRRSLEEEATRGGGDWTHSEDWGSALASPQTEDGLPAESMEPAPATPWTVESLPAEPIETIDEIGIAPWNAEPLSAEAIAPAPWSEEPADWDAGEPSLGEEAEAAEVAEAAEIEAEPAEAGVDKSAAGEATPPIDMIAGTHAPDDSLAGLHVRIRTADELLALPSAEQAENLAFLEPSELNRVVRSSDDRRLKKGVIDVLENLGTPASLEALRGCLEDPDPEVLLYALDAIDRLLGAE